MKLKTLKDLMVTCSAFPDCNYECIEIDYKELKQEAIKWVNFQLDIQEHNPRYSSEYRLNIQWIKHFFNIT